MYPFFGPLWIFTIIILRLIAASQFSSAEKYEMVKLFKRPHPEFKFNAFGDEIILKLTPNRNIVSPKFVAFITDGETRTAFPSQGNITCNYLHADELSAAAFDFCDPHNVRGVVMTDRYVMEIQPVEREADETSEFHLIRRTPLVPDNWRELIKNVPVTIERQIRSSLKLWESKKRKGTESRPVVEIALFFDEAAYKLFSPFFQNDDIKLKNMLLAYVNAIQAVYHHPSAGMKIDFMLTYMEIFKTQPTDLPHYAGERSNLLDSFCAYNEKHNPKDDKDPKHWDMGLYVSGLDFYAIENGKRSGITMGLASVGGVCQPKYACVIAEFGVTNMLGKPYPSAGFTSVYVLAHEMGHNLGMHHDSSSNTCPKDGFIMSPSRGTNGETLWSHCSADILKGLDQWAKCLFDKPVPNSEFDHMKFKETPGAQWGPKKQCELLLRDSDADYIGSDKKEIPDICVSLQCRSPHRAGFYFAGPALEGSTCGVGKMCKGGSCTTIKNSEVSEITAGGWSSWRASDCQSSCLINSIGYQFRHRDCNNPVPEYTNDGCEGPSFEVLLCPDNRICRNKPRMSAIEYASRKCYQFQKYLPRLDKYRAGLQAPHEQRRLWVACAVFCRQEDSGIFYSPRIELNDIGIDPYFPDGTWCHNDGKFDYYCRHHHCLPENFSFTKDSSWINDILIAQNARPHPFDIPQNLADYFSLNPKGAPISTNYHDNWLSVPSEDDWATVDYVEIPEKLQHLKNTLDS